MSASSSDNALIAKVHALYGKRLDAGDYAQLLQKRTVSEIAGYLKNETYFSDLLAEVHEELIHREQLEALLNRRTLDTYLKLVKYSYGDKLFFIMYKMKNEIDQLLTAMRLLNAGEMSKFIVAMPVYLAKHMSFDLFALAKSRSYDDMLNVIERSEYYNVVGRFRPPTHDTPINIPMCETSLLTHYYTRLLGIIRKYYKGVALDDLEKIMYYEIDFHNINVIYRMKRYYNSNAQVIGGYLIDVRSRIKRPAYLEMASAPDYNTFTETLKKHRAGRLYPVDRLASSEQMFFDTQRSKWRIMQSSFRFAARPVVAVISYMMLLDVELNNLVNIIEGTRYNLNADEIRAMLVI